MKTGSVLQLKVGLNPTKVRNPPQVFPYLSGVHFVLPGWRFPILRENLAGRFEGNTPELSCSFSLEKSCSLSRLRCPHDWSEWIAIIRRNLSRSSGVLAGCERVNAEVRREALQHYARQPLKLDQKERNPETQGMKSYGGFSTYVGLEP